MVEKEFVFCFLFFVLFFYCSWENWRQNRNKNSNLRGMDFSARKESDERSSRDSFNDGFKIVWSWKKKIDTKENKSKVQSCLYSFEYFVIIWSILQLYITKFLIYIYIILVYIVSILYIYIYIFACLCVYY